VAPPRWLTLRKQPFAVVQGGSPHALRNAVRFASAFGLSNASTMATVEPEDTERIVAAVRQALDDLTTNGFVARRRLAMALTEGVYLLPGRRLSGACVG